MEIDEKILTEKKEHTMEEEITINNETYIFKTTRIPILDVNNNVSQIIGFALDITELKQKEKELISLVDALKEELFIQNKIRKITNILISQDNLKELFKLFLDEIDDIVYSDCSDIALIEDNKVKTIAYKGYEKYGIEDFIKNFEIDIDKFPTNLMVLENKKPLIINDTTKEEKWVYLEETAFIKSFLNIPILLRDKIIGFLRLVSSKENAFTQKDADRLTIVAGSLGLAIENIKNLEKIRGFSEQILNLISKITELKDTYTAGHQKNVSEYAIKIAKKLNLPEEKIEVIKIASLLHDIGKIILPFEILTKPFKLTPREYELVKEHPKYGNELLKDLDIPYFIKEIILQHHERLNGTGYPKGLKGDEILLEAKIIAVADVFDAMNSHRPYRPKYNIDEILNELISNKGTLYEPQVVDALLELYKENKLI